MKKTNLSSIPLPQPISPPGTNDILPLKPLTDIPDPLLPWLLAIAGILLVALLIWWWRRRSRRQPPVAAPVIIPPHIRARQRLEQALGLMSDPRLFCIAVSDATRIYLEERFDLHAPERTTEEFLHELQHSPHLTEGQKQMLAQFLERCDLVKFARFEPTEIELRGLHTIAGRLVDDTAPSEVTLPPDPNAAALVNPPRGEI